MRSALILSILATVSFAQELEQVGDIQRGLTPHFIKWLNANGYGSYKYERTDLTGGSYGGKSADSDEVKHYPVVFFHGNSDIAVGTQGLFNGFTNTISYFLAQGYTKGELYVTTWGTGIQMMASYNTHSKDYLTYLRKFTEAVFAYTGAEKINVISHSMGVTLGRRVIKGGMVNSENPPFDLGPSLAGKVDTFIGIAGANYGLINCYLMSSMPTCNRKNGFYPGDAAGGIGLSTFMSELDQNNIKEADHVFSMFSTSDDLIGYGNMVYGRYTSMWPTVDESKTYTFSISCHMHMKMDTAADQYNLITNHRFKSTQALE